MRTEKKKRKIIRTKVGKQWNDNILICISNVKHSERSHKSHKTTKDSTYMTSRTIAARRISMCMYMHYFFPLFLYSCYFSLSVARVEYFIFVIMFCFDASFTPLSNCWRFMGTVLLIVAIPFVLRKPNIRWCCDDVSIGDIRWCLSFNK